VVDLRRNVLLSNLQLGGAPHAMILKPDGGELYVTVPDLHTIEIINTWTTEIAESMLVGLAPEDGVLSANAESLYLSDSAAGRVLPIAIGARHLALPITVGRDPVTCKMDPSGELLLVANQESNDLAVIRLRTSSLLTMVPVGSHPTDIVALLF
jgi:YVTN family beta-propeller protein